MKRITKRRTSRERREIKTAQYVRSEFEAWQDETGELIRDVFALFQVNDAKKKERDIELGTLCVVESMLRCIPPNVFTNQDELLTEISVRVEELLHPKPLQGQAEAILREFGRSKN